EQQVTRDHDLLGSRWNSLETQPGGHDAFMHDAPGRERRLLAVVGNGDTEGLGVLERRSYQMARHHRFPVVAHGHGARAYQLTEFRELLPLLAERDGADRIDSGFA